MLQYMCHIIFWEQYNCIENVFLQVTANDLSFVQKGRINQHRILYK